MQPTTLTQKKAEKSSEASFVVTFESNSRTVRGVIRDLTPAGCSLSSTVRLKEGEQISLRLQVRTDAGDHRFLNMWTDVVQTTRVMANSFVSGLKWVHAECHSTPEPLRQFFEVSGLRSTGVVRVLQPDEEHDTRRFQFSFPQSSSQQHIEAPDTLPNQTSAQALQQSSDAVSTTQEDEQSTAANSPPSPKERRDDPRVSLHRGVVYAERANRQRGFIINMSRTGALIETTNAPPTEDTVVSLALPSGHNTPVRVSARVVRCNKHTKNFAVSFVRSQDSYRNQGLDSFIQALLKK